MMTTLNSSLRVRYSWNPRRRWYILRAGGGGGEGNARDAHGVPLCAWRSIKDVNSPYSKTLDSPLNSKQSALGGGNLKHLNG